MNYEPWWKARTEFTKAELAMAFMRGFNSNRLHLPITLVDGDLYPQQLAEQWRQGWREAERTNDKEISLKTT